jgi:beta-glucosidase
MHSLRVPDDLLLGTATAGLQIEGGDVASSWHRWADEGRIRDRSHPSRANDHWNRTDEDVAILRELGVQTHRLGVEWARIEPVEGEFSAEALAHYRTELTLLRDAGIVPLVTLHHFTNPLWFEDDGGWLNPASRRRFLRFVRFVVRGLSDLVTDWVTINEPNVYLLEGFILGEWPPGHSSIVEYLKGIASFVRAHRAAYRLIHRIAAQTGRPARVGVAHHLRIFDAAGRGFTRLLSVPIARLVSFLAQGVFVRAMTRGVADYLGVNYYTRDLILPSPDPGQVFSRRILRPGCETNDLGWEIYPAGLSRIVRKLYRRYRLPVWITENGTCDASDRFRAGFIRRHLGAAVRLVESGVPVERFYHWTLIDNFEWVEGESAPFGLVALDFTTQTRRIRASGRYFQAVCRARTLDRVPPGTPPGTGV